MSDNELSRENGMRNVRGDIYSQALLRVTLRFDLETRPSELSLGTKSHDSRHVCKVTDMRVRVFPAFPFETKYCGRGWPSYHRRIMPAIGSTPNYTSTYRVGMIPLSGKLVIIRGRITTAVVTVSCGL